MKVLKQQQCMMKYQEAACWFHWKTEYVQGLEAKNKCLGQENDAPIAVLLKNAILHHRNDVLHHQSNWFEGTTYLISPQPRYTI